MAMAAGCVIELSSSFSSGSSSSSEESHDLVQHMTRHYQKKPRVCLRRPRQGQQQKQQQQLMPQQQIKKIKTKKTTSKKRVHRALACSSSSSEEEEVEEDEAEGCKGNKVKEEGKARRCRKSKWALREKRKKILLLDEEEKEKDEEKEEVEEEEEEEEEEEKEEQQQRKRRQNGKSKPGSNKRRQGKMPKSASRSFEVDKEEEDDEEEEEEDEEEEAEEELEFVLSSDDEDCASWRKRLLIQRRRFRNAIGTTAAASSSFTGSSDGSDSRRCRSGRTKRSKLEGGAAASSHAAGVGGGDGRDDGGGILQFVAGKAARRKMRPLHSSSSASSFHSLSSRLPIVPLSSHPPPPLHTHPFSSSPSSLWIEKHRPLHSQDLSIPPKKVYEIRAWLRVALSTGGGPGVRDTKTGGTREKLLILRGPPGVGKSALVSVLAQEEECQVLAWTESTPLYVYQYQEGESGGGDEKGGGGKGGRKEGGPYVSQAKEFRMFLRGAAYRPLEVEATAAAGAAGAVAKGTQKEEGKRRHQGGGAGAGAEAETGGGEEGGRLLFVMEEMPYHASGRASSHFLAALSTFLSESVHPAIVMFTEEHEDRAGVGELEKFLSRGLLQAQGVQQIHVNPVTDANMRRILTRIAAAEGMGWAVDEVEGIVAFSRGDLRHAILTLQLQLQGRRSSLPSSSSILSHGAGLGKKWRKSTKRGLGEGRREMRMGRKEGEKEEEEKEEKQQKDAYTSNFHAIGKVLHAKRRSPLYRDVEGKEGGQEARGRLAFVPEDVLGKCEMEVDGLATFIQAHCVPHFGGMNELSQALGFFSDADVLLARVFSTAFQRDQTDAAFPHEYVLSLLGRTVACTNVHPVGGKGGGGRGGEFRGMTAPRFYESLRQRREKGRRLTLLCEDYLREVGGGGREGGAPVTVRVTTAEMVRELIPFAKQMMGLAGPQKGGQTYGGGEGGRVENDEGGAESLASALSFLRLFNQRVCPFEGSGSGVEGGAGGAREGGEEVGPQLSDLGVDDIEED
ncbi:cell cycle checkpoint protein rad17 [Nannochloropsis oceanica]